MKNSAKKHKGFRLDSDQVKKLEKTAKQQNTTQSKIVRDALKSYLDEQKKG
ncbi:ribbon-helix-helix protein, CopG family [Nostoc sp. FACHB-190]|uniref:ribbon-helix-helix protein, CopG family n=1 Tax=Nostoc sp. FACHB-190 TaxID=2692838 RepID=UPI001688C83C|nr:ribbon-helix-helix protein, CopG family [Nostoc sp. FACHB-190]MBD2303613.1 CopG family transcriptional regulator [Nostoc sp. FACHB-190]